MGVITALDLAQMDPVLVRRKWSVVLERTVRELNGQSCIALEDIPTEKKQIAVTRSFGAPVTEIGGAFGGSERIRCAGGRKTPKARQLRGAALCVCPYFAFSAAPSVFSRGDGSPEETNGRFLCFD